MKWYLDALKKYAVFGGRAQRKEYWFFVLFNIIFSIVLSMFDGLTGTLNAETGYGLLSGLYTLAVAIPGIAVSVRRLHDTGRTGWWFFILLIPVIGAIIFLVFMFFEVSLKSWARAGLFQGATRVFVRKDHGLFRIDDLGCFRHEVNPAKRDDLGIRFFGLVG